MNVGEGDISAHVKLVALGPNASLCQVLLLIYIWFIKILALDFSWI